MRVNGDLRRGSANEDALCFCSMPLYLLCQGVALETASRLLKPAGAGTLAVTDFFLSGGERDDELRGLWKAARWLEMTAQRLWFKQVSMYTHPSWEGQGLHLNGVP